MASALEGSAEVGVVSLKMGRWRIAADRSESLSEGSWGILDVYNCSVNGQDQQNVIDVITFPYEKCWGVIGEGEISDPFEAEFQEFFDMFLALGDVG